MGNLHAKFDVDPFRGCRVKSIRYRSLIHKVNISQFAVSFLMLGYLGGRIVGVGGRANIDPGNHWRDHDEIFHRGCQHPREDIGYMVGVVGGRGKWAWHGRDRAWQY